MHLSILQLLLLFSSHPSFLYLFVIRPEGHIRPGDPLRLTFRIQLKNKVTHVELRISKDEITNTRELV